MPSARPTLYLVDSMSNIHRAYHAIQRLSTSAGRPTNAVYGFVTMLRKMVREHSPDLLAAAWDGPQRTLRHEAYAEYKANRAPMADDLASQLPEIREALAAYRIPVIELPGYEADDVIGSLAKKAESQGYDVVIVTADKDMLQLVSGERIRVFHTGKEIFLDDAGVTTFFGVAPGQVADVLALMGDSVDNIPGVPGVGAVTAKKWIAQYGSLAALLEHADEIKGKVGESLRAHREDALLSRRLVEIPVDLPVPFDPDGPAALRARLRTAEGALRPARVPFARGRDPRGRRGGARAHVRTARPRATLSADRRPGGRRPAQARRPRVARRADGREDVHRRRRRRGDRGPLEGARGQAGGRDSRSATRSRSTRCWPASARRSGPTSSTCAWRSTCCLRASRARSSSRWRSSASGQRLLPDKEAGVSACALPEAYEIANADRWLAERASAAAALAPLLSAELAARPELDRLYREIERPLTPVLARMERAGVAIDAPLLARDLRRGWRASCAPSSRGSGRRPARSSTSTPPSSSARSSSRS